MPERFSDRHGYRGTEQEITVREDAPEGLRFAIPLIAQSADMSPTEIRRAVCHVLLVPPDPMNWSDKGQARSGGGNHRGSIFRLIVGAALIEKNGHHCQSWGQGSSAPRDVREGEQSLERAVSKVIGDMPFLWLAIEDKPGPDSLRGHIERNAIALLSNFGKSPFDSPSKSCVR